MTLLHQAVEAKRFDTRVIERNVARGVVSPKDADASVSVLPDDADNAEYVNIEALAGDESGGSDSSSH